MGGRLTLSWVNKDQALMSADNGSYEWFSRDDARVTEVRLLHAAESIGEVTDTVNDNLLIRGDSYDALRALVSTVEYAARFREKVKLAYIDPPFNTGQAFEHYDDNLEHSVWLGMMRERLLLIRDLLAPDGSVWVHLDDAEVAYCRVLMDEIFGRGNFVATVIWQKIHARNNTAQHMSTDHDYLLVYAKQKASLVFDRVERTELSDLDFWNPDEDARGPWRRSDLTASHAYAEGKYEVTGPHGDVFAPRPNRWWSCSKDTFEALRSDDRLWWGKTGHTFPFRKRFQSELGGLVPTTIWAHDDVGDNRQAKGEITHLFDRTAIFATPKPERLLHRIIHIATAPGDVVLDCFAGSGTTGAVAHKMGRRWVMAEASRATVDTFTKTRMEKVVENNDAGGITAQVKWAGGGGFRVLEVGPSLYERAAERLFLADWAKGEAFGEAVAAQLGFRCDMHGPFTGRRGRMRLAVIDGVADEIIVKSIVSQLGDEERVTIVGKGAAPGAAEALRQLSVGSRLLKAPTDLVRRGRVVR